MFAGFFVSLSMCLGRDVSGRRRRLSSSRMSTLFAKRWIAYTGPPADCRSNRLVVLRGAVTTVGHSRGHLRQMKLILADVAREMPGQRLNIYLPRWT